LIRKQKEKKKIELLLWQDFALEEPIFEIKAKLQFKVCEPNFINNYF